MGALQGPVFCLTIHSKQGSIRTVPVNGTFSRAINFRRGFWGSQGGCRGQVKAFSPRRQPRMFTTVMCCLNPSSNGNLIMDDIFSENDEDYVDCSVADTVDIRITSKSFLLRMRDGEVLYCPHNIPQAVRKRDYTADSIIMLKVDDGSNRFLPIIVSEMPSVLAAIRDVPIQAPVILSQNIKEILETMGYSVKLIRVTKRLCGTHLAQLYVVKVGDETKSLCFVQRSSEAIDVALRCKVPIQVNKHLVFKDAIKKASTKEVWLAREKAKKIEEQLDKDLALIKLKYHMKATFHYFFFFLLASQSNWASNTLREILKDFLQKFV